MRNTPWQPWVWSPGGDWAFHGTVGLVARWRLDIPGWRGLGRPSEMGPTGAGVTGLEG